MQLVADNEARNMCGWWLIPRFITCVAGARLTTCVGGAAQSMMQDLVAEHDAYEPYGFGCCDQSTRIGHIPGGAATFAGGWPD